MFKRTLIAVVGSLFTLSMMGLTSIASASTATNVNFSQTKGSSSSTLSPSFKPNGGGIAPNGAVGTNPYGCIGQSNYPHKSTHIPGNITAEATTTCDIPLNWVEAGATLTHAIGLGFETTLDSKDGHGVMVTTYGVNPGAACPTSSNTLYCVYGTHKVIDFEGTEYDAQTYNQQWVTCG